MKRSVLYFVYSVFAFQALNGLVEVNAKPPSIWVVQKNVRAEPVQAEKIFIHKPTDKSNDAAHSFYLGSRYLLSSFLEDDSWGSLSPFVGSKGAFVWQQMTSNSLFNKTAVIGSTFNKKKVSKHTGAHVGVDWSINANWGLMFTSEAAVREREAFLNENSSISFPVTFGLRYSF